MPHAYLNVAARHGGPGQHCSKTAYLTRKDARRVIGNIAGTSNRPVAKGSGTSMQAYSCTVCKQWHIGHT